MALQFKCNVVGLEVQKDLVIGCEKITSRMQDELQGRVTFRQVR